MQIYRWYNQTSECRHVYMQRVFDDGTGAVAEACGSRCDFCRRESMLAAIVQHFEEEHVSA